MGCNCGGNTNNGWNYVAPNGSATTYKTEVEALAAKVRAGGVGEVKKAP
jgi:hypothetical protein